ncbi:Putative lumazine-binding [Myroides marinus]|uniref:Putative lumazine-binding n=1 Tax=Myroides marinus TaxID=703342 RepID=A0A1H6Y9E1_9FLAO|nr:nuclear transport factor 2 family protein [Myroides marinus]SEJ33395.1 Putative lumazine-binding [Myroides marinus]
MKSTIKLLVITLVILKNFTMLSQEKLLNDPDKIQLITVVEKTFAQGALNQLNVEQMNKGFHSDFNILIANGTNLFKLSLAKWIEVVNHYKNSPDKVKSGIRNLNYKIEVLDITDSIAIVKTQFFRNNELIITDYLSYIKFEDSWKAVSKISKEHISNPLKLEL